MSKTVQFKRGNANVSATYVGAQGEITVNTDNYTLNVHDGVRAGGYTILNANVSNIGNLSVTNQTIIGTSANTNITLSPNNASVVLTSNLVTPNIAINRYTIQSVNSGSSLTLPAETDAANVDLTNTFSNIRFTTYDPLTNAPYTLVLNNDSDVIFPGYIKSNLGSAEIQFAGGQGLLMYANFDTGSTGISLNDTGTSDIFANVDLRLTTNYSGAGKQWLFGSNGTLSTTGNLSTANLSISHAVANNTVQVRTLANSDLKLVATDGIAQSAIYLWANNQRMSFNTISNAFDFNFNGQLSATDFTASKNSAYGYSFYAAGGGYSGMRHTSGPPDFISIEHEGNIFAKFISNATVDIFGNLVVSADGQSFGSFPTAFVQVYANVDTYSQMVLQNINDGTSASTDVVVTADNGDDASYYINMGILGSNHASPDFFGDTKNYDDGYLIVVGNDSTGGAANVGNLILGSTNGIVKTFVGNIAEANVVTTVSESLLTVAGNIIPAANVTYGLGTETNQWKDLWLSNTTLYMGGTAITVVDGTLSVGGNVIGGGGGNTGNVTFNDQVVQGTGDENGGGGLYLAPGTNSTGNLQYLRVRGGDYPTHIHLDTGNNNYFDQYFGADFRYVKLEANGNILINADDDNGNSATWTFDYNSNLITPGNITGANVVSANTFVSNAFNVVTAGNLSITSQYGLGFTGTILEDNGTLELIANGAGGVVVGWDSTYGNGLGNIATVNFNEVGGGEGNILLRTGNRSATEYNWIFDKLGTLTLPGEGVLQSRDDSVTLSSLNTTTGNINSMYLSSGGGVGFFDQAIGGNWLEIFRSGAEPQIRVPVGRGNLNIQTAEGINSYNWVFSSNGDLDLPGSLTTTSNVTVNDTLFVVGSIQPTGASPAPYLSGFSSISTVISGNANEGNITAHNYLRANGGIITTGTITGGNLSISGNITGNTAGFAIGYRDVPQVVFTSNATLALTDAGKHYYSSNSANIITVPNNATVSFNIGAAISIVQQGTANLTITPGSGVTMYLAGNATSSSRLLGNYGMATLMKVGTDTWFINGTGLT